MRLGAVFDPSNDSIEISIVRPPFDLAMGLSTHVLRIFRQGGTISFLIQTLMLLFVIVILACQ